MVESVWGLHRGFGARKSRVGTRLNAQPRATMRGKQRIIKQSGRNFQSRGGAPRHPPYSAPTAARPGLTVAPRPRHADVV